MMLPACWWDWLLKVAQTAKGSMFLATNDNVVQNFNLEQLAGSNQIPRDFDVRFTGRGIIRGMVVGEDNGTPGHCNDWPEDVERCDLAIIQSTQADQIVTDDAFARVEHQYDQRFLGRVKPVSFGDVVAPVLSHQFGLIQDLTHRLTFPDQHHFELMRGVRFHSEMQWSSTVSP